MENFANDFLVRPAQSDGDLSITIHGPTQQAAIHAFRQILRATRGLLVPRWSKTGSTTCCPTVSPGKLRSGTASPFRHVVVVGPPS